MDYVVIVNSDDVILGIEEKLLAHQKSSLHRAVSVCLFDEKGRWLLQRRAHCKYHSPGRWANSCCSHPYLGEEPMAAALRRVKEELGVDVQLESKGSFIYQEDVGQGLVEHEYDYVFTGQFVVRELKLNPEEVDEVAFFSSEEIVEKLKTDPHFFAPWFFHVFTFISKQKSIPSLG